MPDLILDRDFQRQVARLLNLGGRAVVEFLLELTPNPSARALLLEILYKYTTGSRDSLCAAGGDSFPSCYIYEIIDGEPRPARRLAR